MCHFKRDSSPMFRTYTAVRFLYILLQRINAITICTSLRVFPHTDLATVLHTVNIHEFHYLHIIEGFFSLYKKWFDEFFSGIYIRSNIYTYSRIWKMIICVSSDICENYQNAECRIVEHQTHNRGHSIIYLCEH